MHACTHAQTQREREMVEEREIVEEREEDRSHIDKFDTIK